MKQIFKHLTAAAITFFVCSKGHTSQTEIMSYTPDDFFAAERRPQAILIRHNACRDLARYQDEIQGMVQVRTMKPVVMQFPNVKNLLRQVADKRYPKIAIHIPRHNEGDHEPAPQLNFDPTSDYSCIVSLSIFSSAGDMRGYWKSAVRSLIPFINQLPRLMELTLSQHIVEDIIGELPPERYINVDFNSYSDGDIFYSTELLKERADAYLTYLQDTYRNFHFQLVPIVNPLMRFASDQPESIEGSPPIPESR